MSKEGKRVLDPATHRPSKAGLEEDMRIEATPGALTWAVIRSGEKREDEDDSKPPIEILRFTSEQSGEAVQTRRGLGAARTAVERW